MSRTQPWIGRLVASVPTPMDGAGEIHDEGLRHLVSFLGRSTIGGVAVGTPLGRGSRLTPRQWDRLLSDWREGLGDGRILVASVGATPETRRPSDLLDEARALADRAAARSADVLIVQPPGAVRGRPERDRLILEYHSAVAEAGLPLLLSYRRESSGGIAYGPEVLAQLLARPEVLGVEIGTIDGITLFQQVEALARQLAPEKLVVSGEERFLGYSLMCGADAALVGIGAAYPAPVLGLLDAHFAPDPGRFLARSAEVDALARPIFRTPTDGSPRNLLQALERLGVIPPEAVNDPWGPRLGRRTEDR